MDRVRGRRTSWLSSRMADIATACWWRTVLSPRRDTDNFRSNCHPAVRQASAEQLQLAILEKIDRPANREKRNSGGWLAGHLRRPGRHERQEPNVAERTFTSLRNSRGQVPARTSAPWLSAAGGSGLSHALTQRMSAVTRF